MQLIKTAIIKAGNGPAAFAATAQHCPAAGMLRLLCISPQPPKQAPQTARWSSPQAWPPPQNGTDCPWQRFWEGSLSLALVHQVFMWCLLCARPCATHSLPDESAPASYSTGCSPSPFSRASLSLLASLRPPLPRLLPPAGSPWPLHCPQGQGLPVGQLTCSCSFRPPLLPHPSFCLQHHTACLSFRLKKQKDKKKT